MLLTIIPSLKAGLITVVVFIILFFFRDVSFNWNLDSAGCVKDGFCHCEVINSSMILAEPINVYSSLFYLFSGLLVFFRSKTDGFRGEGRLFLFGSIVICFGSIMFHASISRLGLTFDFLGITTLMSIFYLSRRLLAGVKVLDIVMTAFFNIVILLATYFYTEINIFFLPQILTAIFGLVIIQGEVKYFNIQKIDKSLYKIVAAYVLAYGAWWLGNSKYICDRSSLFIHYHSLWHLGGAIALYYLYIYLRNTTRN